MRPPLELWLPCQDFDQHTGQLTEGGSACRRLSSLLRWQERCPFHRLLLNGAGPGSVNGVVPSLQRLCGARLWTGCSPVNGWCSCLVGAPRSPARVAVAGLGPPGSAGTLLQCFLAVSPAGRDSSSSLANLARGTVHRRRISGTQARSGSRQAWWPRRLVSFGAGGRCCALSCCIRSGAWWLSATPGVHVNGTITGTATSSRGAQSWCSSIWSRI